MKIENIKVEEEENLSAALRPSLALLLSLVTVLLNRLGLNSRNSSKPPASDPNREKKRKNGSGNRPGGQKGHAGNHLELVDDPDHVEVFEVDRATLAADGSPTTRSPLTTPCAMPTIYGSSSVPGSRTSSSGPNTRRRYCWRSTRQLMLQAVC